MMLQIFYISNKIFQYNTSTIDMDIKKDTIKLSTLAPNIEIFAYNYTHIYRDGGFRLQQENIKDKYIFHNYGQGDAQVSLAYGSAYIISKIITVKQDATKIKQVAVLGDGCNALMTSLELVKRGYKVTLYGKNLPVKKINNQKIVNPQEGVQFWYPAGYDNCDPLKHQLLGKLSFEFINQCLLANRYQSLKLVTCYVSTSRIDQLKQHVTQYINNQIGPVNVTYDNYKTEQYIGYKTILIDTRLFLQQVFTQLKLRNLITVQKQFNTLDDVLALKQKCIYNCLGIQSKTIFGDNNIQVRQGCFYTLKNQDICNPTNFSFWINSDLQKQDDFVISVFNNKIQVKSLFSHQPIDQKGKQHEDQKLLMKAFNFIKQRTINPSKL